MVSRAPKSCVPPARNVYDRIRSATENVNGDAQRHVSSFPGVLLRFALMQVAQKTCSLFDGLNLLLQAPIITIMCQI
jgi:hypothetical protein